jgi:hypothetical protein
MNSEVVVVHSIANNHSVFRSVEIVRSTGLSNYPIILQPLVLDFEPGFTCDALIK